MRSTWKTGGGHLEEICGAAVSPRLISTITDAVTGERAAWPSRPLEPLYAVMFFDAIRVKVRDQGTVCKGGPSRPRHHPGWPQA